MERFGCPLFPAPHNDPLLECKLSKPSAGPSGSAYLIIVSTSQHSPAAVDTVVGKTDTVPPRQSLLSNAGRRG